MVSGWIMKPRWYSVPPPSHSFVRKPSQNVSRVWGTILYNVHAFKKKSMQLGGWCTSMWKVAWLKMYGTKGVPPATSHQKNLLEIDGFRWFSLHMSRISSDLVKKAHTTFLGSLKVLSSRGIIGLIVATQHGCNTAATYDIWTPLNVLKGVVWDSPGIPGKNWMAATWNVSNYGVLLAS